ncbi:TPA: filamentous hemagglutinin N-terminal domain-containing protein, partial [Escherichia coli]|nr:filamentous hemagglutinin N-terminal domain-containing protein [Escherichia coli]
MNHIYRLKFDRRRNELIAVSEITTGAGKLKQGRGATCSGAGLRLRRLALSALSGLMMLSLYPQMAGATLPTGGVITAGSGSITTTSSTQMDITQSSQNMIINWTTFNIGADSTVNFWQPDSSSVVLSRVTGGTESQILGTLNANGQVFLVNPSGILFGSSARVNTAGFVASTRDISDEDFLKQCYTFSGNSGSGAAIINQGNLTTTKGGYIVLAADLVKNSGTISTPGGSTVMAAAETVTLQLDNGGLTTVTVNGSVVNALVENSGLISARDGRVYLTALGKDMLLNTVLNVSGVVDAGSMSGEGGSIVLDGGDSGTVTISGSLQADSTSGQGGRIVVQGDSILQDQGSSLSATGATGGGEVYVGGGWQGNDSSIRNASQVVMKDGATINVSATGEGDGGTAVLWSEDYTQFDGGIQAAGGVVSGNGGQVETSSHNTLVVSGQVNAAAVNGSGGNWLLDPVDITIVDGSNNTADTNVSNTTADANVTLTGNGTGSSVTNTTIETSLNNGTSVTILTNGTNVSGQSGNITVNADITKSNGSDASLTLQADGNITVNKNITSTNGALNVTLSAANSSNGSITLNGATISTSGGDITLHSANSSNSLTVNISGSTLNATNGSGGNITINATSNTTTTNANVVYISSSNLAAEDNISITGTATGCGAYGVTVNNSNLSADSVNITASAVNKAALYLLGDNTFTGINASTSSVALNGTSTSSTGIWMGTGNQTFINVSTVTFTGSSNSKLSGITVAANASVNASGANLSITGTSNSGLGFETREGNTITADNITLNSNGGLALINTTVNSTAGDIRISGNSSSTYGVFLDNTTITACKSISIDGVTSVQGNISSNPYIAGVSVNRTVSLTAPVININGSYIGTQKETTHLIGSAMYLGYKSNLTLEGNSTINLVSNMAGLTIYPSKLKTVTEYINVVNGSLALNVNVNGSRSATKAGGIVAPTYSAAGLRATSALVFNLINSDLTTNISVNSSSKATGIGYSSGGNGATYLFSLVINGTGNATINSYSSNGTGIFASAIDNTGLNGTLVLNGSSTNGIGIKLESVDTSQTGNSTLVNATIIGNSVTNVGVSINTTNDGTTLDLNGNNITGITDTGNAALLINGKNVNITNSSITGTATAGNGSGVLLNGTGNYTVDGATVTGSAVNGCGVIISGNLTVTNASVTGESINGTGVVVSGNLSDSNITGCSTNGTGVAVNGTVSDSNITGNAAGNGTGVTVSGNVTNGNITGNSGNGTGVTVSGNVTNGNITGNSGNGTGVTVSGNVTNGNITGNSGNGTGVSVEGNTTLTNTTVSGETTNGTGVDVSGNLTG